MARAKTTVRGRAPLARDSQQWMLDYLIQETGKVFHFQGEGRGRLPRSVRSHDMISKHLGLPARRMEALATGRGGRRPWGDGAGLLLPGHRPVRRRPAHHLPEQRREALSVCGCAPLLRPGDRPGTLSPRAHRHPLERHARLGQPASVSQSGTAPLVFYIPGCDTLKEAWPHPFFNAAHQRGHARVLVRRSGARGEQPPGHPPDRGQLRGSGQRGAGLPGAAAGDRRRADRGLRHQPRLVLGPAFRRPGPAHSRHRRPGLAYARSTSSWIWSRRAGSSCSPTSPSPEPKRSWTR